MVCLNFFGKNIFFFQISTVCLRQKKQRIERHMRVARVVDPFFKKQKSENKKIIIQ